MWVLHVQTEQGTQINLEKRYIRFQMYLLRLDGPKESLLETLNAIDIYFFLYEWANT